MKPLLVGGPLLGGRKTSTTREKKHSKRDPFVPSRDTFEPLVSPPVAGTDDDDKPQRFVFLPNTRFITVLAYKTGTTIGNLVPCVTEDDDQLEITTATLESSLKLLAGCSDGSVREFPLEDLRRSSDAHVANSIDIGPYRLCGPCYRPSRIIHLSKGRIEHMEVAMSNSKHKILYMLSHTKNSDDDPSALALLRAIVPVAGEKERKLSLIENDNAVQVIDKDVKRGLPRSEDPFTFKVNVSPGNHTSVDIVLGLKRCLLIYHEKVKIADAIDIETFERVAIDSPKNNRLSALAVSASGKEVACGYSSGSIRVMTDLLGRAREYCRSLKLYEAQKKTDHAPKKPSHPSKKQIVRKFHWHAHPVSSLVFGGSAEGGDPMLFSGGDESVLVTWQLSRGISKPVEVLPRIALAGIVKMTAIVGDGDADSVLLWCADNSLSLFETHNQYLRWKIQGLAAQPVSSILPSQPKMWVEFSNYDNTDSTRIFLTGLSQAPGCIHSFDTRAQRVVSTLEAAPYNRISRTEIGQKPMPTPNVTHCSFSADGTVLLTIDVAPTENESVGACEKVDDSTVGSVSSIRFWSTEKSAKADYELVAVMASPHGSENKVSAVALSGDGLSACTVSNDEKAFRLWRRVLVSSDENDLASKTTEWVCRFRVDFPSGFANYVTGPSAVSFSDDGSVIAIGFGHFLTLWNHDEVTLLTSFSVFGDSMALVEKIRFVTSHSLKDALIVSSSSSVTLLSPYGSEGPSGMGWSWNTPSEGRTSIVATDFIAESSCVCICLFEHDKDKSHIFTVDALSGDNRKTEDSATSSIAIMGEVVAITGHGPNASDDETHMMFALTTKGEIFSIGGDEIASAKELRGRGLNDDSIPKLRLPQAIGKNLSNKRPNHTMTADDWESVPRKRMVSLERFGAFVGEESVDDIDLPFLSGEFARSFIGRHLQRD